MSTIQSTSNLLISGTTIKTNTTDAPMLSQNSVLLNVGEPSSAATNDIDDMDDIVCDDSGNSNSSNGDSNKQVIFLLFLK